MFVNRKAAFAVALAAALCAACAEIAANAPPTKTLTDREFQAVFEAARSPGDAFREDRNVTAILARTDLSLDQRLRTLNFRAIGRSTTGENKNGAIEDYEEFVRLAPSDHPLLPRVREDLDYVKQQKLYIEDRLEGRAQTDNTQRFQDLLALGRHDEAVSFMRLVRLNPNPIYIEKLAKLGFLCEGAEYSGINYQWGTASTGYHVVFWCDTRTSPPR